MPVTDSRQTLSAAAKINWFLTILGRRGDGFHELATLLQSIDLHDDLEFQLRSDGRLTLEVTGGEAPSGPDNLVLRAAGLFQEAVDGPGADLRLHKRIPAGAGLGGGSSDAACALIGLNRLWGAGWDRSRLARIGARIGSDVPFFLWGGTALGTGRGEKIEPLDDLHPGLGLLLIRPPFQMATADVYGRFAESAQGELTTSRANTRIPTLLAAVREGRWRQLSNDLEKAALALRPELNEIRDCARGCGADVLLCGSGSTLLALGEKQALNRVEESCGALPGVTVRRVAVLPRCSGTIGNRRESRS